MPISSTAKGRNGAPAKAGSFVFHQNLVTKSRPSRREKTGGILDFHRLEHPSQDGGAWFAIPMSRRKPRRRRLLMASEPMAPVRSNPGQEIRFLGENIFLTARSRGARLIFATLSSLDRRRSSPNAVRRVGGPIGGKASGVRAVGDDRPRPGIRIPIRVIPRPSLESVLVPPAHRPRYGF